MNYTIKIETQSDLIFGNGQSVPGFIDSDVLHDRYGFPYMNGKTFKGKIGEMANLFIVLIEQSETNARVIQELKVARNRLFGVEGKVQTCGLKFSDCEMAKNLRMYVAKHMKKEGKISKTEVLETYTYIDRQTSIDRRTGIAKEGSLRNFRVIKRGVDFLCSLHAPEKLNQEEEILLGAACILLKHLGGQETKGKGQVKTSLWLAGKDVTQQYMNQISQVVKKNV